MMAANRGDEAALAALLSCDGINVNTRNEAIGEGDEYKEGMTALIFAAKEGHTEAIKTLLSVYGLEVNTTDTVGRTALDRATEGGHAEAADALRSFGGVTGEQRLWDEHRAN